MAAAQPHLGLIGLAVMGSNLARNIESRGFPIAVFNRSFEVTDTFVKAHKGNFVAAKTLEDFVEKLAAPRQIIIMIKAGKPVDEMVDTLLRLVKPGDVIIDGGNSYWKETEDRQARCAAKGVHFLGVGISGGEKGALEGPSLMPGGARDAWKLISPMLSKIAANVDGPCTAYIGPGGSGHFVKMVHNGIEYGDMQLIAEAYDVLKQGAGLTPSELAKVFQDWNAGVLSSFLIEITAKIFQRKDEAGAGFLVDKILDKAGQKGTGKWTSQVALDLGVAIPTLASAVDSRMLSALKDERIAASKELSWKASSGEGAAKDQFIKDAHDALYCSKILAYAQGMALLRAASTEWKWDLRLNEIAALWKGGCIIRARFLDDIRRAYEKNPQLPNLVMDPFMKGEVLKSQAGLRRVVQFAAQRGIPVLAFSASLSYLDSYRAEVLPLNLTQAQRDFFGSHTYERTDRPGSQHTQWE